MVAIEDIRARAKELLESGKVRAVLGYRRGTAGVLAEPAFMTTPEDTATLVVDATCVENLALYLVNEKKRQKHPAHAGHAAARHRRQGLRRPRHHRAAAGELHQAR